MADDASMIATWVQAVSTVVLVAITAYYSYWTRRMAQLVHVADVRVTEVSYDVKGEDPGDEGWFVTIKNNSAQRVHIRIKRQSRLPKRVLGINTGPQNLEVSIWHVIEGGDERTYVLDPHANLNHEDIVVLAQSPSGYESQYRWRCREDGGRVHVWEVA